MQRLKGPGGQLSPGKEILWKIILRITQLNKLLECMMSFQEPDPDIPVLALIVNSAGWDISRFQLAEDYPATITEQWVKWVVITESRIAQRRLQTDQRLSHLQHQEQFS